MWPLATGGLVECSASEPIHEAMFCEPNPQPVKAAAAVRGWMLDSVRPPMVPASEAAKAQLAAAVKEYEAR